MFGFRLVNEGRVPYVNAYEELPEEMRLEGKDGLIFRVEVRLWIIQDSVVRYRTFSG